MRSTTRPAGFTLVELLIVVAIVGTLVGLTIPAVQAARESARRAECENHLRQLALGALAHVDQTGYFPSGGWSSDYVSDASRGYGARQPGGWVFSVLEFVEEGAVRDLTQTARNAAAPALLYCPSRRDARPYPTAIRGEKPWELLNAPTLAPGEAATKCDYAANAGDALRHAADSFHGRMWWPRNYREGDSAGATWTVTSDVKTRFFQSGLSFYRSQISRRKVVDGLSKTYLVGEKFVPTTAYEDARVAGEPAQYGDNQSAWAGFEWDNHRVAWRPDADEALDVYRPRQDSDDTPMAAVYAFGSPHASSLAMAYCDGSVRRLSYDVDWRPHRAAAHRCDAGDCDSPRLSDSGGGVSYAASAGAYSASNWSGLL